MNSSAWRRNSSATIGGCVEIVETTATRTPLRWIELDERAEVAVPREKHHEVEVVGHLHRVDRELDVHVAFDLPASGRIDELLRRLGHHGIAVIVEPIDQRTDGRIFLIVHQRGVVEGANQPSLGLEFFKQALVVDIKTERFRARVQIGAVNKKGDPFQS